MAQNDYLTHTVDNQPPLPSFDPWHDDVPLREAVARFGGDTAEPWLSDYAARVGGDLQEHARLANEHKPRLQLFDRYGRRQDAVEFHPSYHELIGTGLRHGVAGYAWRHAGKPGAHVTRMALFYLHALGDSGTACPITMTHSSVPALLQQPAWSKLLLPKVAACDYDERPIFAGEKRAVTFGMGMTEKQGGSDVRSNSTRAARVGSDEYGDRYELVGHKWFFSAPMSDAFFVLGQAEGGLTCFLLPRFLPDGSKNEVRIQRLKDKVGDWSNASSEVEFTGAQAWRVGDEGRGVATILQMVALTRLDCLIGSAGTMRQALALALHHTRHRKAFGALLAEQPLMQNVLADLALDSEGHVALAARVAQAVDRAADDPEQAAFARVATAIGKYWVCKRTVPFVNEAQECHGGIGYVEESPIARLYRQAPLNSIWEGSGNIQCLDVLRALGKDERAAAAVFAELHAARGGHKALDAEMDALALELRNRDELPLRARYLVERLALALQASLLVRAGHTEIADSFCAARLERAGRSFGTLPAGTPLQAILQRALPA